MSRTNENNSEPRMPDSIALGELAIAASRVGFPMTIFYRYFPADVLGALWQFHLRGVGPKRVQHVGRERDVRQLEAREEHLKLVLVSRPRLYQTVAWAAVLRTSTTARPAIFCKFPDCAPDEDPAVTLVLHGRQDESDKVANYLGAHGLLDHEQLQFSDRVVFDQVVDRAVESTLQRRRDRQAVRGLLAGEFVLRSISRPPDAVQCSRDAFSEYRRVYDLLQSPVVRATEEHFDPLARDMVNRANAYLMLRQTSVQPDVRVARNDDSGGNNKRKDLPEQECKITRRELTDLGNTKGLTVRRLIKFLLDEENGLDTFCGLAAARQSRKYESWPSRDPKSLARLLTPWSQKQVRDHFHRLYQLNLITAKRAGGNKPWQYAIPETLVDGDSVFRRLPRPETLFAGDFPPSPHTTAPDAGNCPTAGGLPNSEGRPK